MLHKTNGIVLRAVKYGDSSLVTTIFTAQFGVQAYMVQGVRSSRAGQNRAGLLQPGMLLEMVVTLQQQKNLQRIREFQAAYLYSTIHEQVVKNSIVIFSVELLQRLLPEQAPLPALFDVAYTYFVTLDKMPRDSVANFPLYFIIQCSRALGYDLKGTYSSETQHLNLQEGGFTVHAPAQAPFTTDEDARALSHLSQANGYEEIKSIALDSATRLRLLDWYILFLQQHTQHMGHIRSLSVLRAILH